MATVKPTSKNYQGAFSTEWATLFTAMFDDVYMPKVAHKYGPLVGLSDILSMAGKTMPVPNATMKLFERSAPWPAFTLLEEIATGAEGASISFKIAVDEYDDNGNPPISQYETIEIPYKYMQDGVNEDRLYWIKSAPSGSGTDLTWTAIPVNANGTYDTASKIDTAVTAGTVLRRGHNLFAPGSGQPSSRQEIYSEREFVAAILAATKTIEGGQLAQAFRDPVMVDMKKGGKGILFDPIMQLDYELRKKTESYFVSGERTDNSNMTMTSQAGNYSAAVKSGFGFMRQANIYSQKAYYADGLSIDDLAARKLLLRSQGLNSKNVMVYCGINYTDRFEKAGLDYVQQYSSSDLLDAAKNLGVEFKSYMIGGIKYTPIELNCFSDPTTFGINVGDVNSYQWPDLGLYIPSNTNNVKINGKEVPAVDNIILGYVKTPEEDRTRMIGIEAGVNGMSWVNSTMVANQYDKVDAHMKTELMVICINPNQWILDRLEKPAA